MAAKKGYSQTGGCSIASRNSYAALQNSNQNRKQAMQAKKASDKQQTISQQQSGRGKKNGTSAGGSKKQQRGRSIFTRIGKKLQSDPGLFGFLQLLFLILLSGVVIAKFFPDDDATLSENSPSNPIPQNIYEELSGSFSIVNSTLEGTPLYASIFEFVLAALCYVISAICSLLRFCAVQGSFAILVFSFVNLCDMMCEGGSAVCEVMRLNYRLCSLDGTSEEASEIRLRLLYGRKYKRIALAQDPRMIRICEKISHYLKTNKTADTCSGHSHIQSVLRAAAKDPLELIELINPNLYIPATTRKDKRGKKPVSSHHSSSSSSSTIRTAFEQALRDEFDDDPPQLVGGKGTTTATDAADAKKTIKIEDIFERPFAPANEIWTNSRQNYQPWSRFNKRRLDDAVEEDQEQDDEKRFFKRYTFSILFHGTRSPSAAKSILASGFDPRKRRGQAYGPGEYFDTGMSTACGYCNGGALIITLVLHPKKKKQQKRNSSSVAEGNDDDNSTPKLSCFGNVRVLLNPRDNRKCTYALPLVAIPSCPSQSRQIFE